MAFDADSLGLNAATAALLRDAIHERLGLFYENSRLETMVDRLAPRVAARGFGAYLDYYYFLKYDPSGNDEWHHVMDALSVPETYFWREIDQLQAVVNRVVPQLVDQLAGRPLRIWSVPCASGEEPLTLAMLLEQCGWFRRAPIELHAGDASGAALSRAARGLFRERALRALPDAVRDRFFHQAEGGWLIDPAVHARVRGWHRLNLVSADDLAMMRQSHIVFCRNVFIYFSDDVIRRTVDQLADVLASPAYLCVGASESLLRLSQRFELEEVDGAFVYVKRSHETGFPR
jgi:chemotaxis protein methyltransferase CheR